MRPAPPRDFCDGAVLAVARPLERWLGESPPLERTAFETPLAFWAVDETMVPPLRLRAYEAMSPSMMGGREARSRCPPSDTAPALDPIACAGVYS